MVHANRWQPTTEQELLDALAAGILEEGHSLELKKQIPRGSSANKELARDLASFAIDGGLILIGIAESDDGHHVANPVELDGLRERIDQVARSLCDPPVLCATTPLRSATDGSLGYLVVRIPPSSNAPHMVDGVYYGRSDTTKFRLPDSDVLRLHERRRTQEDAGWSLLRDAVAKDPVPIDERTQAHLFIVANPTTAPDDLALSIVDGEGWTDRLRALLLRGLEPPALLGGTGFAPDWHSASNMARRPDGVAASTNQLESDRTIRADAYGREDILEIQVSERGVVRLFLGRLSDTPRSSYPDESPSPVLFDEAAVLMTRRVLSLANGISETCGYFGPWSIGVAATGVSGLAAYDGRRSFPFVNSSQRYDIGTDSYEMVRTVTLDDISRRPGTVTGWLWGRFLRALNRAQVFEATYLSDPAEASSLPD